MGAKYAAATATQEAARASLRVQVDQMNKEHDMALFKLQAEAETEQRGAQALEGKKDRARATNIRANLGATTGIEVSAGAAGHESRRMPAEAT